ncbi:AAA family ATPase [Sphingobacterium chuzhouense]|uniref:AAA family ATPase n=1 Tax=Sphingobacterium chuzhouense TaxID=1742264 RepID=A0ABR7XT19_9SPHI|nr:AAA family ATPase [Sphingobacterium chuzhouense]MBD1422315.1 AAA family ATPase [Sphingobacterium chuzhouense]
MLQIRKIYLENFKGVHYRTIVDFEDKHLTILSGPNGFGKTTIFDVIELCLRGRLNRTMTYNHVTKKNSGHKKPFYQNTVGEDVLLKLWLTNGEEDHVIIKRLDKDSTGSISNAKAFRPDAWELIDTFYTQDTSQFEQHPDYSEVSNINQEFIDNLFFGELGLSMVNLYPLFNYLQQEDNIYFLKKDEDAKKNELAFLFQTQRENENLEKVTEIFEFVTSLRQALEARIVNIGLVTQSSQEVSYFKLFPESNYVFDTQDPFGSVSTDQLESVYNGVRSVLQELLNFSRNFSPNEFERRKLRSQLSSVANNRTLLQTLVAKNLIEETRLDQLRLIVAANSNYISYLSRLDQFICNEQLLQSLGFPDEFIIDFNRLTTQRTQLLSQIGEIGKIIRDLNNAREQTITRFNELHSLHPQDTNCPLCNSHWNSMEEMYSSFESKAESLMDYNRTQQRQLSDIEQEIIENFNQPIIQSIQNHISSPNNLIDQQFFQEISERRGNLDAINRFMTILNNHRIDVSRFIINDPVTLERFNENILGLQTFLTSEIDNIALDEESLVGSELYSQYFQENPQNIISEQQIQNKLAYIDTLYNNTRQFSLNVLSERFTKISELEKRVKIIKDNLSASIKQYKKTMIEKIKIPFYIYSGKILQHYQQGYGIFVDVKDSTSRVRFLTGESTDHDIIHHLSSGQLAVVSIAFCLALNKVYHAPQHFKFLAIDDPVQTLDDLNIHSFIELLRHEFSDYKIIISTHEEHIANYLLYKFEKFHFSNKKINVQENFYNRLDTDSLN